jgi:phosphatidate cytidylyltransferase
MKRIVTALFLVPAAVYTVLFAPWWIFNGVVVLVACLCFREYAQITGSFAPLGFVAGIAFLLAPPHQTLTIVIMTTLAAMCLPLAARDKDKAVPRSASLVLGILYIFGAWKIAILLHDVNDPPLRHLTAGRHWLMFGLMVNWIGDTGAYYVGRRFGRRKLAPEISPGKTWEGSVASSVAGMLFGLIYLPLTIMGISLVKAGLLALAANAAGQLGDLAESAIKRGAGVKDSGALLPGHGGMLDRVDSTMFALPVLYTLLVWLQNRI